MPNEWGAILIICISYVAVTALWGFVLGIYHRLKYLEMQVEKLKGEPK